MRGIFSYFKAGSSLSPSEKVTNFLFRPFSLILRVLDQCLSLLIVHNFVPRCKLHYIVKGERAQSDNLWTTLYRLFISDRLLNTLVLIVAAKVNKDRPPPHTHTPTPSKWGYSDIWTTNSMTFAASSIHELAHLLWQYSILLIYTPVIDLNYLIQMCADKCTLSQVHVLLHTTKCKLKCFINLPSVNTSASIFSQVQKKQ